jgi:hypothetical protein
MTTKPFHAEYKIAESVAEAYQRPNQKRDTNKGSFSAKNQPGKKDADDE